MHSGAKHSPQKLDYVYIGIKLGIPFCWAFFRVNYFSPFCDLFLAEVTVFGPILVHVVLFWLNEEEEVA